MKPSAALIFPEYVAKHEGILPYMYADKLNLVTAAFGNLLDAGEPDKTVEGVLPQLRDTSARAMQDALALPWKHRAADWSAKHTRGGAPATQDEIRRAWIAVKTSPMNGRHRAAGRAYEGVTDLTLEPEDMAALFRGTAVRNENALKARFLDWDEWPADAQLAAMDMAWALGDKLWTFTRWMAAARAQDWRTAAKESRRVDGYGRVDGEVGTSPNERMKALFTSAANVVEGGGDGDLLHLDPPVLVSHRDSSGGAEDFPKPAYLDGPAPSRAGWYLGAAAAGAVGWFWWRSRAKAKR